MPTLRHIYVGLQSQYDALSVPEFADAGAATVNSPYQESSKGILSARAPDPDVATLFVPIYFGSQFWILYNCPEADGEDDRYYYFRLYGLDGKCLLSWGSRADSTGRIAFGIYSGGFDSDGNSILQKKSFFFPNAKEAGEGGNFEIRVYRSRGRKRDKTTAQPWVAGDEGPGLRMLTSGHLNRGEPKRSYTYALTDALDEPYVRFQYHARTSDQLQRLGISVPYDITSASPSKKSAVRPAAAMPAQISGRSPNGILAKDSLALRRTSTLPPHVRMSIDRGRDESGVHKEQVTFDALEGLSLAKTMRVEDARSTSPGPPSLHLFKGIKGRFRSRNESRGAESL